MISTKRREQPHLYVTSVADERPRACFSMSSPFYFIFYFNQMPMACAWPVMLVRGPNLSRRQGSRGRLPRVTRRQCDVGWYCRRGVARRMTRMTSGARVRLLCWVSVQGLGGSVRRLHLLKPGSLQKGSNLHTEEREHGERHGEGNSVM